MTLIEKIARHLCMCNGYSPDTKVASIKPGYFAVGPFGKAIMDGVSTGLAWEEYEMFARETILQIREPTAEMITACPVGSWLANEVVDGEVTPREISVADAWKAMTDELLTSDAPPEPEREPEPEAAEDVPLTWRSARGLS